MKIALIAFDGLDPRVVYDRRDELPTFDKLLDNSMNGKWQTPGHTIPSFTATLTGEQYEECNFHWDEGKGNYQRHRQTGYDYLWEQTDASMSILNSPVLYPPEDIEDAMVCGLLTPDSLVEDNLAKPQEVQDRANSTGYVHDIHAHNTYDKFGGKGMLEHIDAIMTERTDMAQWLINKYDSDLFYGVWSSTDRWGHIAKMYDEDYFPVYEYADRQLERMLETIPDGIPKIIFSDHGFAHFDRDEGVHKGHMYEGFYAMQDCGLPDCRDDSLSIFDLHPTVLNYLNGEAPEMSKGRVVFNTEEQNSEVKDRLDNLGYLE